MDYICFHKHEETTVPPNSNNIPAHVVYRIKSEEQGEKRMKEPLSPSTSSAKVMREIRKDSYTKQFHIIRHLVSITAIFLYLLLYMDIKCAHLQGPLIKRCIYVTPPFKLRLRRNILWKLRKVSYESTEDGRQWAKIEPRSINTY